jgi:spermidine/putrescine transport system substrate-binding protein
MKRIILILTVLILTALSLTSCGDKEDEIKDVVTLNVYNWGEYISDGFEGSLDSNKAFEEYFNKNLAKKYGTRVKVNYSTYATNEDMYSKISGGSADYIDIVIPSDYMIQKMIANDLLVEIDTSKLSNYVNISEDFKGMYYDPEDKYSVPYTYGMLGIIYNAEFVSEEDVGKESWGLLWEPKYDGKILQFNNPRDAFATAIPIFAVLSIPTSLS